MDSLQIGHRIAQRRQALGLTLDDVAEDIGVARSTIQRYEKGVIGKIKLPVIEAIARSLQVDPAWLCGMSDDMCASDKDPILPELTLADLEMTADDFMCTLYSEAKDLPQDKKDMLLSMARFMRIGVKAQKWTSDKAARVDMPIDSQLLNWIHIFAEADDLSLEDEIEKILYEEAQCRIEDETSQTEDVTGMY